MADRSSVAQKVQVRVEVTPGTDPGGAGSKQLLALSFAPNVNANFDKFTPQGLKYPTVEVLNQEWSSSPVTGSPTYTEIVYPLSMILGAPVITADTPVVGATQWVWSPSSSAADVPLTLTVERGDAVQAEKVSYGLLTEFSLNLTRQAAEISGQMIARQLQTGITLNPVTASLALVPITSNQVGIFLDTTSGALGTTRYTRVLRFNWAIGNRFGPIWPLDDTLPSYAAHVELMPNARIEATLEADAVGMALLTKARAGDTAFCRAKCTGPIITGSTPYLLQIDSAVKVAALGGIGDQDGIYKVDVTLDLVHDATWTKATTVKVVNNVTAL